MKYDPTKHHRRSIRLKGYDYAQDGAYFVTIVTHDREFLCGEIVDGGIALSRAGRIVQHAWLDLQNHYPHVILDEFVIMPNHVHGIFILMDQLVGRGGSVYGDIPLHDRMDDCVEIGLDMPRTRPYTRKCHGLPEIIWVFKSFSARRINAMRRTPGIPVWQRNYYEHIVRNDEELARIRNYIRDNPLKWEVDRENPTRG